MYAYVVNGEVKQVFDALPASFANISGLNCLTKKEREAANIYDVVDTRSPLPSSWHSYQNQRVEAVSTGGARLVADITRPTDAEVRQVLKDRVNDLRDQKLAAGFTFSGYSFDSDPRSLANITATVAAVSAGVPLPPNFTWRSKDNVDVPIVATSQMVMLGATALAFGNAIYQASWAHKAAIDAASDPTVYDITTGW